MRNLHKAKAAFEWLKTDFREKTGLESRLDFLRDESLYGTALFAALRRMPKGADLHAHTDAILPLREQMAFVADHPELGVLTDPDDFGRLRYFGEAPMEAAYLPMRQVLDGPWNIEDFRQAWTVLGAERNCYIWDHFEGIFSRCSALCATPVLVEDYYTRVFRYYHAIGVEYMELRSPFFGTREEAVARGEAYLRALQNIRREDPHFVFRIVACGGKNDIWDPQFDQLMDNARAVRAAVRDGEDDLVVAIDIVNDEDRSYSLARYEDRVRRMLAEEAGLHLTLHAGESLRGENNEIAIALRCGIERLGHGFNLYRYPSLLEEVRRRGICIEVCPVSNAALGYCEDFARHPARDYRAAGIPLVICSDDACYQADETLIGDYLAVIMGWDLGLEDVAELCRNSLRYAFLPSARKEALLRWWEAAWDVFLSELEHLALCKDLCNFET